MITSQPLKGFRDFLPHDALKRDWLKIKINNIFQLWGYDPVETPTLEPLELFAGAIGEDEKLFFKFEDQGGRKVALRYDQTLPIVRVIAHYLNILPRPFKRYQIQNAYRAEKPQKGRYREFLQCDADIFGDPTPYADAEVIALSLDIYKKLGFKNVKVLINDRNLLHKFPYEALVSIDKLKKIGQEKVINEMVNKGISLSQARQYLTFVLKLKPNETINVILKYLKDYGFENNWFEFDSTIVRSFAYSQGPIWEVVIEGYTAGSVLGGERYDKLFRNIFGLEMFGTGFALGFDRTLEAAELFELIPKMCTTSKVLVTIFNSNLYSHSLKLADRLRNQGLTADVYPNIDTKLDKQLKYADKKGIPYVAILGPNETSNNTVIIKDMKKRTQETVKTDELARYLQKQSS